MNLRDLFTKPVFNFLLGITMLTLTPAILSELQQRSQAYFGSIEGGVLVARVTPGSPADRYRFSNNICSHAFFGQIF